MFIYILVKLHKRYYISDFMPLKYVVGKILLSNFAQEINEEPHWFRRYNKLKFDIKVCYIIYY